MQGRKQDSRVGFNLWNVQGAWFWSLIYPDRHGGAIGAAGSEAEAVGEAQAAIERLPQFVNDRKIAKDLRVHIGYQVDRAMVDFECSEGLRRRRSKIRAISESYSNLWQLTLQHYAARVAGV
jgi:hypothetical protein